MKTIRSQYLLLVISAILLTQCSASHKTEQNKKPGFHQEQPSGERTMLPNGWSLSPAGHFVDLADLPLNVVVSHSGKYLAVTNNGYGHQSIMLFNPQGKKLDTQFIPESWLGLAFGDNDHYLYASEGNEDNILVYAINDGKLSLQDSLKLGKPWPKQKISPTGIAVDNAHNRLFTVTKEDSALYEFNLQTKQIVHRVPLGAEAYTCLLSPEKNKLYISLWGGEAVDVFNANTAQLIKKIPAGSHPTDMVLSHDGKYLYVANANDNTVSIINTEAEKVIETINSALYPDSPAGSTPNGLALSENGKRLYIANADNNCLAVFDVTNPGESRSLGFIPTGWYPTSVKVLNDKIYVTNGKGQFSMPNPKGPNPTKRSTPETQYIARILTGTMSIIPEPDEDQLHTYTKEVYRDTPYKGTSRPTEKVAADNPIPQKLGQKSPIKHVFYIIKENRTYDQVLGDVKEGNGDSSLTLFGRKITPNEHKLVHDFVLLDNFYVNAEVSADGHNWSTAAYATDYVQKTWPTNYSGRGGSYDYEGSRKVAFPRKGFIWDYCERAGVSYRSYGEFIWNKSTGLQSLKGHFDKNFIGFNLHVRDVTREKVWEHDFDSLVTAHSLPQFMTIRFPNDHTAGLAGGMMTPLAYAADNDLGVGRFIDHLSHSPVWKSSVVFIVEDDAQDGPDHVDSHRSTVYVVGPYVKRHQVIHTMYSTASVLHTMELILGLPPMSQYDAAALPMYDCFTSKPNLTPYNAMPENVDMNKTNPRNTALARESDKFDLAVEDAAPEIPFNEVIWKAVKGKNSVMPAPRHSAFVRPFASREKGDDDD